MKFNSAQFLKTQKEQLYFLLYLVLPWDLHLVKMKHSSQKMFQPFLLLMHHQINRRSIFSLMTGASIIYR